MLENTGQGSRTLNLRRRRSRLPWVYLVYQEGLRDERPRPLAPHPFPLTLPCLSLAAQERRHVECGERIEIGVSSSLIRDSANNGLQRRR